MRRKFFALLVGGCLVFNSKGGNDEYSRAPFVGGNVVSGVPNYNLSQLPDCTDVFGLNNNKINEQMSIGGIGAPFVGCGVVPGVPNYNLSQLPDCTDVFGLNNNKINEQMPVGNIGGSGVINDFFVSPKFGDLFSNGNDIPAPNNKYTGNAVIDSNNAMICSNILGIGDTRNDSKGCKTQEEGKSFSCIGKKRNRGTGEQKRDRINSEELKKDGNRKSVPLKGKYVDSNIRQVIKTRFNRSIIILLNKLLNESHIEKMENDYLVKSKSDLTSKRKKRSKNLESSSGKLIDREVKVKRKENFINFFLSNNTSRNLSCDESLFSKKVSEVICFSNKIVKHDIDRNKVLCNKINGYFDCNSGQLSTSLGLSNLSNLSNLKRVLDMTYGELFSEYVNGKWDDVLGENSLEENIASLKKDDGYKSRYRDLAKGYVDYLETKNERSSCGKCDDLAIMKKLLSKVNRFVFNLYHEKKYTGIDPGEAEWIRNNVVNNIILTKESIQNLFRLNLKKVLLLIYPKHYHKAIEECFAKEMLYVLSKDGVKEIREFCEEEEGVTLDEMLKDKVKMSRKMSEDKVIMLEEMAKSDCKDGMTIDLSSTSYDVCCLLYLFSEPCKSDIENIRINNSVSAERCKDFFLTAYLIMNGRSLKVAGDKKVERSEEKCNCIGGMSDEGNIFGGCCSRVAGTPME